MSKIVCELGDATIRESDVAILQAPGSWLNDSLIAFYIEWVLKITPRNDVVVLNPSAAFMLRLLPIEDLIREVPRGGNPFLQARSETVEDIYVPLNNANDPDEAGGGSHWSLLVIHKSSKIAEHYDSANGTNSSIARKTASCFKQLLNLDSLEVVKAKTFQQTNSFDCGVYLCLYLARDLLDVHQSTTSRELVPINAESARRFRTQLLELIHDHCTN